MAELSLHRVRRVHPDGTAALDGIDLVVPDGGLTAIIGPSGSGKSTLLRVVAGIEAATSGMIRIDGEDLTDAPARQRNIAFLAQQRSLYEFLDVAEQLAFPLRLRRTSEAETSRRVGAQRRAFRLGRLWRRRPRQLSAGDAQRTAIARAMVREPRALLLDEPLQLLDPPSQRRVWSAILQARGDRDMTMLYATNDHGHVLGVADQLVVLRHGRIAQIGSPQEVLARPVDRWVAGFVGEPAMSFVDAEVIEQGGLGWLRIGEQRLRFPGGLPGPLRERAGSPVVLGARPDLLVPSDAADRPDLRLDGVVRQVQPTGPFTHVEVDVGAGSWLARYPSRPRPAPGDLTQVTVAVRRLAVFDPVDTTTIWFGDP